MNTTTRMSDSPGEKADTSGIWGHPRGLTTLFFTEMWERFSYYGMRALLILYMTATVAQGGLGFPNEKAGPIYGTYTGAVYLTSLLGGAIADAFLGARRTVLIGGIIIACGHFCLAVNSLPTFYTGLCLIALGTGFLKPNVSKMVGDLYSEKDVRRDAGFSIFYMGINLGAFIAPFVTGFLGQKMNWHGFVANWHYGFAAAGFGMVAGLIQYVYGFKNLGNAGLLPVTRVAKALLSPSESKANSDAIVSRLIALTILFAFSAVFWMAFEQAGSSLNLFAEKLTRRSIFGWEFPSSYMQSVQPLLIIILAPVFSAIWLGLGKRQPSSSIKFALGLFFAGFGFLILAYASSLTGSGPVSPLWLILVYTSHTIGELCLSPVGLSTFTRLAPARIGSSMMGLWFVSIGLGNYVGGRIAGHFVVSQDALVHLFGLVALVTIGAGVVLAAISPFIKRLAGE